jgi:hypothetical protein
VRTRMAVTVLVMAVGMLFVPSATAQAPTQDSVTGNAVPDFDPTLPPDQFVTPFVIDARSGPSGGNPTGTAEISVGCTIISSVCTTRSNSQGGDVTCLNVSGNRAVIGYYGILNFPAFSFPVRSRGLVEVVDNGPPGATPHDSVDWLPQNVRLDVLPPERDPDDVPITDCPDTLPSGVIDADPLPPLPEGLRVLILGGPSAQDFTVTDAQAFPTSKDECKNGGWRDFPGFRNQGDCVSFVARS